MEPVIPLYACSRCRTIYQEETEALDCFRRGIKALKIHRGSVFKLNIECFLGEGNSEPEVTEGESYFVLSRREDSKSIGHYAPFSGFCFSKIYTDGRFFDITVSPVYFIEMAKPEFEEVRGYLQSVRDSSWGPIEESLGVKKRQLRRGMLDILPENAQDRLENMRRALGEAVNDEHYEAAEIYREGIIALEEEITFAQHQR